MRVGIFQSAGGGLTPEDRLSKLESNLKQYDLDMIVCPELFVSGYNVGDQLVEYADSKTGSYSNRVIEMARETKTAIVYGYPEKDRGRIYNSALCVSAVGEIIANHRKLMLPPGFERDYFSSGDRATLFQVNELTCSILVCYDAEYPEAVRHMAQAGAQVVIVPTALTNNWGIVAEKLIPTRAFENGIWLVYANHSGVENELNYYGGSCIVAPDGNDAARAGSSECVIFTNIDAESVSRSQARLPYLEGALELGKKIR